MSEAEKVEGALSTFCDAIDAAVTQLRGNLGVETHSRAIYPTRSPVRGSVKLPFDASKIQWQQRQGEKGPFELSEDTGNPEHKAMLKFLNDSAGGCISSEGSFYWVFPNGSTIGRKQKKARRQ